VEETVWWAAIITNLVLGLFFTLFLHWSGAKGLADGSESILPKKCGINFYNSNNE